MKVKVISHNEEDFTRSRSNDIYKLNRNLNPELHPFEKAREYTRALNATKLERLFAKPFIGSLSGHIDGIYAVAKNIDNLTEFLSGSADGEIRLWDLSTRHTKFQATNAHRGFVRGLCFSRYDSHFVSVGSDKLVKVWKPRESKEAISVFNGSCAFSGVDHHRNNNIFATSGTSIDIWDISKSQPISSFTWGVDSINTVKFNQTEVSIIASAGSDRTIVLYDIRSNSPLSKMVMKMKTNAIAWNPMEAFNFSIANEDHQCYTFDMRKLDIALNVFKNHVSAVIDLDYSPTGQEIVTGSYDKTIRIFNANHGHSREVYHTKRMQRLTGVRFSMDSRYVLSSSDDGNVRLWKAIASDKIAELSRREEKSMAYNEALKSRYSQMPEIKRISRSRNIPKFIKTMQQKTKIVTDSIRRKTENRKKHSKTFEHKAERKKSIIAIEQ